MPEHEKLELIRQACRLLGTNERAAELLGMTDRSLRYLLAGDRAIHTGLLEDISKALIDHAGRCRSIERQLNPAFAENLQGVKAPHHKSAYALRGKSPVEQAMPDLLALKALRRVEQD